ncbi:hypothetical protein ABIB27_003333 [Arthrobacter sp. UYEF21]
MSLMHADTGKRRRTTAIVLTAFLVALLAAGVIIQRVSQSSDGSGDSTVTTPGVEETGGWTPERMRSATPQPMP